MSEEKLEAFVSNRFEKYKNKEPQKYLPLHKVFRLIGFVLIGIIFVIGGIAYAVSLYINTYKDVLPKLNEIIESTKKLQELESQIGSLELGIIDQKGQLEKTIKQNAEVLAQVQKQEKNKDALLVEIEKYTNSFNDLRKEKNSIEVELPSLKEDYKQTRVLIEKYNIEVAEMGVKKTNLEQELGANQNKLIQRKTELSGLESEYSKTKALVDLKSSLEERIKTHENDLIQNKQELINIEKKNSSLKAINDKLEIENKLSEKNYNSINKDILTANEALASINEKVRSQQNNHTLIIEKNKDAEKQNSTLQIIYNDLMVKSEDARIKNEDVGKQSLKINADIQNLKSELEIKIKVIAKLNSEKNDAEKEVVFLKSENAGIEKDIVQSKNQKIIIEKELKQMKNEKINVEKELLRLKSEVSEPSK